MLSRRKLLLGSGQAALGLHASRVLAGVNNPGAPINPSLYEGLVASRARMLGSFDNLLNQCMSRTAHIASENLTSIRVCFSNFYNCTSQGGSPIPDTAPGAASTITAAIEYNGTSQQLKFSASSSGTIPSGGALWSDYLTVSIPSGATFWVRQFINNTAGLVLNFNIQNHSSLGECINVNTTGVPDLTLSAGTFRNTNAWSLPPLAIVGMTVNPSMIIVCDSIGAGQGDTEDTSKSSTGFNGVVGTVARSLGNIPFVIIGRSGAKAQTWSSDASAANAIIQKGSHLFIGLGTNDIAAPANRTASQVVSDIQTIAALGWARQKVFVGTLAPRSAGTWTWPFLGRQTPSSDSATRAH
jgi:hypothetical protein